MSFLFQSLADVWRHKISAKLTFYWAMEYLHAIKYLKTEEKIKIITIQSKDTGF